MQKLYNNYHTENEYCNYIEGVVYKKLERVNRKYLMSFYYIYKHVTSHNLNYCFISDGLTRTVFKINKNWVLKVPHDLGGCYNNILEHMIYSRLKEPFAKCYLYWLNKIPYIIMERVNVDNRTKPETNYMLNDGKNQYGTSFKRGIPLYYDYGGEEHLINPSDKEILSYFSPKNRNQLPNDLKKLIKSLDSTLK